MTSSTFCILPWLHTTIEADGRVFPCCISTRKNAVGHLHETDLSTALNSPEYKSIRQAMLRGDEVSSCTHCYGIEKCGGRSMRQHSNEEFKQDIDQKLKQTSSDGTISDTHLTSLDLRFSNSCNFKCRTCGPSSSSSWYEDFNQYESAEKFTKVLRPTKTREEFWSLVNPLLPGLKKLYIAGGEPLLEPDHYLLLEKLIELKNTNLSLNYNTNFSVFKLGKKNAFDYWKHFSEINISLSYDGFGKKGEYIRNGMDWNIVLQNHRELMNRPHIKFFITPTISILNIFHMPEFITYLATEELIKTGHQIIFNILNHPDYYNITILTPDEKKHVKNLYQEFIVNQLPKLNLLHKEEIVHQLEIVLNYIEVADESTVELRKQFLTQTIWLDKKRDEKFLSLFPELIGFYQ